MLCVYVCVSVVRANTHIKQISVFKYILAIFLRFLVVLYIESLDQKAKRRIITKL